MNAYVGPLDHNLSAEFIAERTIRMARDKRKQDRMNVICGMLNSVVAFLAFVFIFGTLALASLGFVYLLVGGFLNILGVFVPGISIR